MIVAGVIHDAKGLSDFLETFGCFAGGGHVHDVLNQSRIEPGPDCKGKIARKIDSKADGSVAVAVVFPFNLVEREMHRVSGSIFGPLVSGFIDDAPVSSQHDRFLLRVLQRGKVFGLLLQGVQGVARCLWQPWARLARRFFVGFNHCEIVRLARSISFGLKSTVCTSSPRLKLQGGGAAKRLFSSRTSEAPRSADSLTVGADANCSEPANSGTHELHSCSEVVSNFAVSGVTAVTPEPEFMNEFMRFSGRKGITPCSPTPSGEHLRSPFFLAQEVRAAGASFFSLQRRSAMPEAWLKSRLVA